MTLQDSRRTIRRLLDERSPADAPTAYYALHHPPARTTLYTESDAAGHTVGFVARCQTGLDLFRPLVTLRCCPDAEVAARLLVQALAPGRPYIFLAAWDQYPLVGGSVEVASERALHVYRLDPARFEPIINVLVTQERAPDGAPRFEIRAGGEVQAAAGINWQSPDFAEVYVQVAPRAQGRGWGRSVVAACSVHVLQSGRTPLYLVEPENEASRALAEAVGYTDTGARYVYAEVIYIGNPFEAN